MSNHFGGGYTYHTGCGGEAGSAAGVLTDRLLAERRVDHALVGIFEGGAWKPELRLPWSGIGVCRVRLPRPAWIVAGHSGRALVVDAAGAREEAIGSGDDAAGRIGYLRAARAVEGRAYAVGMSRQAYRRGDDGAWTRIDLGCRQALGDMATVGFEGIDGFSEDDLYAVGWKGEIWQRTRNDWHQIDSPTNLILTNVCCAGDGQVYACGRRGTLLRGRGSRWELIKNELTSDDFWGIAWFESKLWLATLHALAVLDGDDLAWVDETNAPGSGYHLSAADGRLWSFGPFEAAVRDGSGWRRFD